MRRRNYFLKNKNHSKKEKTFFALCILGFILLVISVFFTIYTATLGARISRYEELESLLVKENQDLQEQILKQDSLSAVSEKAQELNYVKPQEIVYPQVSSIVAKLP